MRAHQKATPMAMDQGMRVGCPLSTVGIDPGKNAMNPTTAPMSAPASTNFSPLKTSRHEGITVTLPRTGSAVE